MLSGRAELLEHVGRVLWIADVEMEKLEEGGRYAGDSDVQGEIVVAVCMILWYALLGVSGMPRMTMIPPSWERLEAYMAIINRITRRLT